MKRVLSVALAGFAALALASSASAGVRITKLLRSLVARLLGRRHVVPKLAIVAVVASAAFPSSALGATVSAADGEFVLYYAAPGELNDVQLSESDGTVTITDAGAVITAGQGCDRVTDHEATCSGNLRAVDFFLGDLADRAASFSVSIPVLMTGQEGDDVLTLCSLCEGALSGDAGADTLESGDMGTSFGGGDGPDTLIGGARGDRIDGGRGKDTIDAGGGNDEIDPGGGDDSVDGGPGRDAVSFSYYGPGVVVDLRLGTATGQGVKTLVGIEDVTGTRHRDGLYGDGERNGLNGFAGNDVLVGRGEDDSLCGCGGQGIDRDLLYGGRGDDNLLDRRGADRLVGGPGDDLLRPGLGEDRAFGDSGDDKFNTREGFRDMLFGGRGADIGHLDRGLDVARSFEGFFEMPTALDNGRRSPRKLLRAVVAQLLLGRTL